MNAFFDQLFKVVGYLTGFIRDLVVGIAPTYSNLIFFGISVAGGYYLAKKYPIKEGLHMWFYALLLFLLLRYI